MMRPALLISAIFFFGLMETSMVPQSDDVYALRREKMVAEQIEARGIRDVRILNAMRTIPRHLFVDELMRSSAYGDHPVPIDHGQTISQPYIVAYMTNAAQLKLEDKVLEIGTGAGYQAAVLAEMVKEVYTIELIEPLAQAAEKRLKDLGYTNVSVRHGDGYLGWAEHAPYDVIIVTAAPTYIPEALIDQLKVGGRMIIPVGSFYQELYRLTKTADGVREERLLPVRFVPMLEGDDKKGPDPF